MQEIRMQECKMQDCSNAVILNLQASIYDSIFFTVKTRKRKENLRLSKK
jgi:hypothetical protein